MYLEIGIGMPEVDIGKTIPGVDGLSHSPGGQRVLQNLTAPGEIRDAYTGT